MFDKETLDKSVEALAKWSEEYKRISTKFANPPVNAVTPKTNSDIPIRNCYFPHDIEDIDFTDIGAPGSYPFTRGNLATQYQFMGWANQPVIGYGLPEHTRERMDLLASEGMIGYFGSYFYNLVYDLVSHEGIDPDHPGAKGRVGQCGMAVYSVEDMARLFEGMDLSKINVVHITSYQVIPVLAQYIAYARTQGIDASELRGNTMNWYHKSAFDGMSCFPPDQGLKLAVELVAFCSKNMPRWNTTNFFGYEIEEAGGSAVQEIGFVLAAAVSLTKACIKAGLSADVFLKRFGFQFSQANDFFEQIAKIRAFRKIWARTMHERFGASDHHALQARIHTHTSGAVLTAQQPLVNLIRTSIHALGAVLSGTQAMEVSAYDEALAIPTLDAATLSLRVQQVIEEETNVTAVSDPLAGSWYVESLTDQLAKQALALVKEIESMGGYIEAELNGWIRAEIETSAAKWRDGVDTGNIKVVGLNSHVSQDEDRSDTFAVPAETEQIAKERMAKLKETRDKERFEKAMERFSIAAKQFSTKALESLGDNQLMEAAIDAASAYATTGEMMSVLKEACGWGPPHRK